MKLIHKPDRARSTWSSSSAYRKPAGRLPKTDKWVRRFSVTEEDIAREYSRYCLNRGVQLDSTIRHISSLKTLLESLRATPADFMAAQVLFWEHPTRRAVPFRALTSQSSVQRYTRYVKSVLSDGFAYRLRYDSLPRLAARLRDSSSPEEAISYSVLINDPFYACIQPFLLDATAVRLPKTVDLIDAKYLVSTGLAWIDIHGKSLNNKLVTARAAGLTELGDHPALAYL